VGQRLGVRLASKDYTTLGGYLFGALGRLPRVGDRVTVEGGNFEILTMEGRRVGEARFVRSKA
jgi:CBS domain containing-hemolysin-like protein